MLYIEASGIMGRAHSCVHSKFKLARKIIGQIAENQARAVLHDYLYNQRGVHGRSRTERDSIFLEAMKVLNVPFYQRWPIYLAVRSFGWIYWKKK